MKDPVRISPVRQADLPALGALFEAAFEEPYGLAAVADLLKPAARFGLIAEKPGPAGFAIASVAADEAEILSIGVAPERRGEGIGKALVGAVAEQAALRGAATVFLEVGADNPAAAALYDSTGFRQVGLRRGYYRRANGRKADARVLAMKITKSSSGGKEGPPFP